MGRKEDKNLGGLLVNCFNSEYQRGFTEGLSKGQREQFVKDVEWLVRRDALWGLTSDGNGNYRWYEWVGKPIVDDAKYIIGMALAVKATLGVSDD